MKTSGWVLGGFHYVMASALLLGAQARIEAAQLEGSGLAVAGPEIASLSRPDELPPPTAADIATQSSSLTTTKGLQLNFRGAPLRLVLDYLSDAGGYVINQEADVRGTIDVWSKDPVSKEEAVTLLNATLKHNGFSAVRSGRILTIVPLENIKTADLEVVTGNNPDTVDKSDDVVTQIIPVRYATASQLVNNLQPLLPAATSLSVNESANSLILVAAKRDIHRILKIVSALDNSIATVSSLKVFALHYADAKQLATVLQQLFAPQSSNQNGNQRGQNSTPQGPFGFGPPGFGDNQAAQSNNGNSSRSAQAKVAIVADETSNSLIVSSSPDLLPSITSLVQQIDQPVSDIAELRLFNLNNADPTELADQISQLFPDTTKSSTEQTQQGFRFGPFPGGPPGMMANAAGDSQASSDRAKKKSQVLAVADRRSNSVLVNAPSTLMPTIARLVEQVDASPARKEFVQVYDLHNADPQDIRQVLTDLFNRNSTQRTTTTGNSLTGDNNPLNTRETEQQSTVNTSSGATGAAGATGQRGATTTTGGF